MKQSQYESYSIGTPGEPWGDKEKGAWFQAQTIKRSYQNQVVEKLDSLKDDFDVVQFGELNYLEKGIELGRYPVFAVKSRNWDNRLPVVVVTGGVHGYETSGVQGAILFLTKIQSGDLEIAIDSKINLVVIPCVSPWGYETINRWNPEAIDPNRSFYKESPAQESSLLMNFLNGLEGDVLMHIDLHETTDSDNEEFRPALAARDAKHQEVWDIPDGFYLVGETANPQPEFQKAIIDSVEQVTHIAPSDEEGRIIGELTTQHGVINYEAHKLGLCAGFTQGRYVTTTEVYPDSPKVDDQNCNEAQVAAIVSGMKFAMENL